MKSEPLLVSAIAALIAFAGPAAHADATAPALSDILKTIRKTRLSMPYCEAEHTVYKVRADGSEYRFSNWRSGYDTRDGREFLRGTFDHIPNYSDWWAYNGRDLLSLCPEQHSGTIVDYAGGRFNAHRPPKTFMGEWYENRYPMRLDQLLGVLRQPRIVAETLDGRPALRVEGTADINDSETLFKAWLDPDRQYLHLGSELCHPDSGLPYAICHVERFEQIDDHWFPVEGRVYTYAYEPVLPQGVSKEQIAKWPPDRIREYLADPKSWTRKSVDPKSDHERVVIHNVQILDEPPPGVFDIDFPAGSRIYNEALDTAFTVGAAGAPEQLDGTLKAILASDKASGAAIADASRKILLESKSLQAIVPEQPDPASRPNLASAPLPPQRTWIITLLAALICAGLGVLWYRTRARRHQPLPGDHP
jgi:hypothetical protein